MTFQWLTKSVKVKNKLNCKKWKYVLSAISWIYKVTRKEWDLRRPLFTKNLFLFFYSLCLIIKIGNEKNLYWGSDNGQGILHCGKPWNISKLNVVFRIVFTKCLVSKWNFDHTEFGQFGSNYLHTYLTSSLYLWEVCMSYVPNHYLKVLRPKCGHSTRTTWNVS